MGMSMRVYVGPYFECKCVPDSLIERHEQTVCCGRGEAGVGEAKKYLVPNCDLDGISREMFFMRNDDPSVVEIVDIVREKDAFCDAARRFIAAVAAIQNAVCQIKWGIVPGVY